MSLSVWQAFWHCLFSKLTVFEYSRKRDGVLMLSTDNTNFSQLLQTRHVYWRTVAIKWPWIVVKVHFNKSVPTFWKRVCISSSWGDQENEQNSCRIYKSVKRVLWLTHWGRYKMAANFLKTFSRAFSWMKKIWILIEIRLKFVPNDPINSFPVLVQIMAWRRPGDKPLSEPMLVSLQTHICATRPQWVKGLVSENAYRHVC